MISLSAQVCIINLNFHFEHLAFMQIFLPVCAVRAAFLMCCVLECQQVLVTTVEFLRRTNIFQPAVAVGTVASSLSGSASYPRLDTQGFRQGATFPPLLLQSQSLLRLEETFAFCVLWHGESRSLQASTLRENPRRSQMTGRLKE